MVNFQQQLIFAFLQISELSKSLSKACIWIHEPSIELVCSSISYLRAFILSEVSELAISDCIWLTGCPKKKCNLCLNITHKMQITFLMINK